MTKIENTYMQDLVIDILEQLDDIKSNQTDSFNDGRVLSYVDVLKTIKSFIDEEAWGDFGIDFDIDKKYL